MDGTGGWLLAIGLAALVVVAIVTLSAVWPGFGESEADVWTDRAVESLRERYARGEIDEREFERRRAYLRGASRPPSSEELPSRHDGVGRDAEHHG